MSILQKKAEEMATKQAERRELQVSAWLAKHGKSWLLFNRWLIIVGDMKGFVFKKIKK